MNKLFPKYALEIHKTISSKFLQTYFVGGAVRNALLNKKIIDVDIATIATPKQITALLKKQNISYSAKHQKFGVIVAGTGSKKIEIATFRKDTYSNSRYPQISFVQNAKTDSFRRDFTMNAVYYNPLLKLKSAQTLDFHKGRRDINKKLIRFIGNAESKIAEDPLRIVRAYRFQLQHQFTFAKQTAQALKQKARLLKTISKTRIEKEINQVSSLQQRKQLQKVIHNLS